MTPPRHFHATAFLDPLGSEPVERLRRAWDPAMARQIAAHVTLVYPEEIPDVTDLVARAPLAAARTLPFDIALGGPFHTGSPRDGVFLHVDDLDGGIHTFRAVAVPSMAVVDFPPHVTIVHPRTSDRGAEAWTELAYVRVEVQVTITEVAVTAFDGDRWQTVQVIPLAGSARRGAHLR